MGMSDRLESEKYKKGLKKPKEFTATAPVKDFTASMRSPASIDWRNTRAVTPVKNQGQCGSCWAFSTAETVESAHYLSKVGADVPILFSPQQIASCVTTMDGC